MTRDVESPPTAEEVRREAGEAIGAAADTWRRASREFDDALQDLRETYGELVRPYGEGRQEADVARR